MDEYIDVKIDVFEHTGQRARLRKNLTVVNLIEEVLKEFDDIVADSPEKYAVYLKGFDRPLTPDQTLVQLDIQPQDELVFDYFHQTLREMLDLKDYAVLQEEDTGKEFDIQWQPAVIGRPSNDMDHNITLAVNAQLLPNGGTISRSHAQITFSEGRFYIEPLTEYNPVYVNGRSVAANKKQELKNGDKLMLGSRKLTFIFQTQPTRKKSTASVPIQKKPDPAVKESVVSPQHTVMDSSSFLSVTPTLKVVIETAADASVIGKTITIESFPHVFGRLHPHFTNENDVSRKHAEITFDDHSQKYYITDLNSTNGVTLNNNRIPSNTPMEIKSGSHIGLGNTLMLKVEN